MPAYKINGKEYSEFDINKRCAELMGIPFSTTPSTPLKIYRKAIHIISSMEYNPCNNPQDTWPIIEKVWDELLEPIFCTDKNGCEWYQSRWDLIMSRYGCLKLKAACIWFIEVNEALKEQGNDV